MPEEQKVIDILLDSKAVRLDVYVNAFSDLFNEQKF